MLCMRHLIQTLETTVNITLNTYCRGPVTKSEEGRLMVMVLVVASEVGSSVGSTMIGGTAELVLFSSTSPIGLSSPDLPIARTNM